MNYWLIKSEPFVYSWDQFTKEGRASWDGVRNYGARNNLRAMQKGDRLLFYHSNEGLEIVGVAEVSKEHYQDPTSDNPNWLSVEVKPLKKLKIPVSLKTIKSTSALANMQIIRQSRLSVNQVTAEEYQIISNLSKTKI